RADAAAWAEQVVDALLAELIVGERVLSLDELELRRLDEGPERAALGADRTVALQRLGKFGFDLVAHLAAMAAAAVGLGIRHGLHGSLLNLHGRPRLPPDHRSNHQETWRGRAAMVNDLANGSGRIDDGGARRIGHEGGERLEF